MKLYIPTSSLNLNNILSSESISPAAFYPQRGFGYSNFHKVDLNPFDNSLVLYSQCPHFEIPKSDLENHAMVIEIESSDCVPSFEAELKKVSAEGIYQYGRTIYLNPYSSKIYFFNKAHYITALSLTEQSGETKLARIYSNALDIFTGGNTQKYGVIKFPDYHSLDYSAIEFDKSLNRIKGFVVGYVIAANRSVPQYIVKAKHLVNEITNLTYAIINSPDGRGTQYQLNMLHAHLTAFSQLANMPFYDSVKEIMGSQKWEELELLMQEYGVDFQFRNSYNYLYHQLTTPIKGDYNPIPEALNVLNNWITQEEQKEKSIKFDLDGIGITTSKLTQYEDAYIETGNTREYYQLLINDVFTTTDVTENTLNTERLNLATSVTLKVKEYEGDKWEDSKVKKWLNQLRRNIAGQETFDLQWNRGFVSAIAAFLLKGDSHDKLTKFLIDCEIEDGRLAFGFYGCVCGFANMSRIFTDELFGIEDLSYISAIYKKLYKQLHQVDLEGELLLRPKQTANKLREEVYDIIRTEKFKQEQVDAIENALIIEEKKYDSEALWFIVNTLITRKSEARDIVEEILKSKREFRTREELECEIWAGLRRLGKKKVSKPFMDNLKRAIELEEQRGNPEAFLCILDDSMEKTDKAYKKLKKRLCPEHKTTVATVIDTAVDKVHEVVDGVLNLFPGYSEKVTTDRAAVHASYTPTLPRLIVDVDKEELARIIQSAINISNDKIIKNLKYVHDQHQTYERANKEVIRHFRNLCFPKDPTKTGSIEVTPSNRGEVDAIEVWLQNNFKD